MRTAARLLRNTVTRMDHSWDRLSEKEAEQRTRIMDLGQALMAIHGRHTLTTAAFALAIGRNTGHIRRHFPDLDSLLAYILHRHLNHIARALGEAARSRPNDQPALREAYAEATRTGLGALTEAHLLLTRDRHLLPADELEILERTRTAIGETIAGELGRQAMLLLDEPGFHPATIERMLGAIHAAASAPPLPARPPAAPMPTPVMTTRPPPGPLLHMDQISGPWPKIAKLPRAGPMHAAKRR